MSSNLKPVAEFFFCVADLGVEEDDPLPDYKEDPHHAVTMKDVFGGMFHSNDPTYHLGRY